MILYIGAAAMTILLAFGVHNQPVAAGRGKISRQQLIGGLSLFAIFLILFGISALRLNVGNDYAKYVEFMHRLYTAEFIDDPGVPTEWGFNLLALLIYRLSGFENYLLVFAIYAFFTVFFFLKAMYRQSEDFLMSFFMFMMLGYYFQSFSTVRYYLALGIALYSLEFVKKKQWIRFVVLILIGAAFHKSVLVVIPLYFLGTLAWKKWQLAIFFLLCSTGLFLQDLYLKIVVVLYPTYEDTEYLEGTGLSYINIIRCLAVLVLALILYRKCIRGDREMELYFYLNLGALACYLFFSFLPFVSRIAYYLTVTQILFVPALLSRMEDGKWKKLFRVAAVLAFILYFVMYLMKAGRDGVLVLPYRTFLFHDMVDILSDVA